MINTDFIHPVMWLLVVLGQTPTWLSYSLKINVTKKLMWFSLWRQGLVILGKSTMNFFRSLWNSHDPFSRDLLKKKKIMFRTSHSLLYTLQNVARDASSSTQDYHLSLTFSTPKCTESLKTSVSKVLLGLYSFIMKLSLQHHLSTVRRTQRCLGSKLRKVSRCGRKKALTPIRYACNLPSSSNKKN